MWKVRKMWLGRILVYAGAASVLFGFLYNSVFGYEHALPYAGFKVLEGGNTNNMLLAGVFSGVVLITAVMVINVANGFKQKDFAKCLFSPNGIAGFVFYWALIFAVLPMLGFGESVVSPWYILCFVGLPLILMFLREPLGKLVERREDWKPEGVGGFIVENLFELIEGVLSYVTNTISFLRVGAFALTHAGMMMVVFLLAGGTGGSENIVVVILGNILVTGIEALLVGIQVLRLEFYEMFGRFYSGSGQPFEPITLGVDEKKR
jgi:V/A-type H+-transporting ATPase subunit I